MSAARLRGRAPSASFVTVASLTRHRLSFDKVGADGSGKCNAAWTGDPLDRVIGVVFEMSDGDAAALDRTEGLGVGYAESYLDVLSREGENLRVRTYSAIRVDASLKPFKWYKQHVLIGARENGLPRLYLNAIESVAAVDDPDPGRHARELAIYG